MSNIEIKLKLYYFYLVLYLKDNFIIIYVVRIITIFCPGLIHKFTLKREMNWLIVYGESLE